MKTCLDFLYMYGVTIPSVSSIMTISNFCKRLDFNWSCVTGVTMPSPFLFFRCGAAVKWKNGGAMIKDYNALPPGGGR